MSAPTTPSETFADRVVEALGPALREAAGDLLPVLVEALTGDLGAVDQLLTVPAGSLTSAPLSDLATSPFLAWLGQLAGLRVPAALDLDEARRYIAGRGASRRGTPVALKTAASASLTGSRRVDLHERNGSPWRVEVVTYAGETPDPAAVLAAAMTEKPVGIVLTHRVGIGQSLGHLAASGLTLGDLTRSTYDEIRRVVPRV